MIGYVKQFDSNKTMSCKVSDNKLLKSTIKYKEKFDSDPGYGDNKKYIKT